MLLFHPNRQKPRKWEENMMTRGKGTQKVMGVQEIANLQDEKKDLQQSLEEAKGYGEGTGREANVSAITAQINRIDRAIEEGRPGRLTSMQKDALSKEA